jgi:hypothetical protein
MAMELVTLEQARIHCKADGEDDDLLQIYLEGAQIDAVVSLNRDVFPSQQALDAAIAAIPAAMVSAREARDEALADAQTLMDYDDRVEAIRLATDTYQLQRIKWYQTRNGIVIDDHIRGAILMTVQHSYQNRSNVVAGASAAATVVPQSAMWIYEKRRYMGETL